MIVALILDENTSNSKCGGHPDVSGLQQKTRATLRLPNKIESLTS